MKTPRLIPALLLLLPLPAAAQLVGIEGKRPPQDLRQVRTPPEVFARAAFSVPGTDFASRVKGIPEGRDPTVLYGPDGEGNLMVLATDGVVSLGPDGTHTLLAPLARLDQARVDDGGRRGAAAIDPDGALYFVDMDANIVRIPAPTVEEPTVFVSAERLDTLGGGEPWRINDLLFARGILWIAANGHVGLTRVDPAAGTLERLYDPFPDLEAAGEGTTDFGVKALAKEAGVDPIVFAMSWDVDGPEGGLEPSTRIGGVDSSDDVFRVSASRSGEHILEGGALPKGMAAVGNGSYLVTGGNGDVIWFNYAGAKAKALPRGKTVEVLKALQENLEDEDLAPRALAADCENRAYLMLGWPDGSPAGMVTGSEPDPAPTPGDVLLVSAQHPEILRITPFGEPVVFKEAGFEENVALLNPAAIARSPKDGALAIADRGSHQLMRFSATGAGLPAYAANEPAAVAFDGDGHLYYLDIDFERDDQLDPREVRGGGPAIVKRPHAQSHREVLHEFDSGSPSALAVRADGRAVVGELAAKQVLEIPAGGGEPVELLGSPSPLALLVDSEDVLWIGEGAAEGQEGGRLLRLPDGSDTPEVILPRPGEDNPLDSPGALAETDDGRIIIADRRADAYEGEIHTGGLFSVKKDGSDLRVLLDHPDYRPPAQGVGVVYIPGEPPDTCEPPEFTYVTPPEPEDPAENGCMECTLSGGGGAAGPVRTLLLALGLLAWRRR